jgi:two-component system sensor histidine kinase YesM
MFFLNQIRNTMKWKLITVLTALIVGVVSSIGVLSYLETSKTIKSDVQRQSYQILKQANLNVEHYFKSYSQGFLMISFSPEVQAWLQVEEGKFLDSYKWFQKIRDSYGQPLFLQHPEILSITLYNNNGNEMKTTFTNGFNKSYKFSNSDLSTYLNEESFKVDVNFSKNYVDQSGNELEIPVLTMVKKIRYGKGSGFLKMDIDLHPALKIVNELGLGDTGYGFIIDQNGTIIMHPNEAQITQPLQNDILLAIQQNDNGSFYKRDTKEFVIFGTIQSSHWKTVVVVPYREFSRSIILIREITFGIALIALILSILIAIAISSSFTKRIAKMRRIIKNTGHGKFDVRVQIEGTDEVADLGLAYNSMLEDLESTVNALAESKVIQQQAVMSALQSQIDSHFLYNTLESINSLANLAGHTQIEETTIALSKMLRYTSDYKSITVSLEQEIEHLMNYLHIMKIRLGDDFEYNLRIDQDIKTAYGLKAVIQPIVENCMKHAQSVDGALRVRIKVERVSLNGSDYISVRIEDNGAGFAEDKLSWIQSEIRKINLSPLHHQHTNIGLINIYFRLKMYYQDDPLAGTTLFNQENGNGAVVEIIFPLQTYAKQGENSNVL